MDWFRFLRLPWGVSKTSVYLLTFVRFKITYFIYLLLISYNFVKCILVYSACRPLKKQCNYQISFYYIITFYRNNNTAAAHTEAETAPTEAFLVCAAIDFGTAYSGYAYSLKHDPTHILTNKGWSADQLISYKTPTCVLLNPQKQFDSFGYEAETKYVRLSADHEHRDWLLFRQFKMFLHNKTVI